MKKRGKKIFFVFLCISLLILPETISMLAIGNFVTFLKDVALMLTFGLIGYLYLMSEEK